MLLVLAFGLLAGFALHLRLALGPSLFVLAMIGAVGVVALVASGTGFAQGATAFILWAMAGQAGIAITEGGRARLAAIRIRARQRRR